MMPAFTNSHMSAGQSNSIAADNSTTQPSKRMIKVKKRKKRVIKHDPVEALQFMP